MNNNDLLNKDGPSINPANVKRDKSYTHNYSHYHHNTVRKHPKYNAHTENYPYANQPPAQRHKPEGSVQNQPRIPLTPLSTNHLHVQKRAQAFPEVRLNQAQLQTRAQTRTQFPHARTKPHQTPTKVLQAPTKVPQTSTKVPQTPTKVPQTPTKVPQTTSEPTQTDTQASSQKPPRLYYGPITERQTYIVSLLKLPDGMHPAKIDMVMERFQQKKKTANEHARSVLDFVREGEGGKRRRFICFDVEAYEWNKRILEIGYTIWENGRMETRHHIIKENKHIKNKKWVKGCPEKFKFGNSRYTPMRLARSDLISQIRSCDGVVGVSIISDFNFLNLEPHAGQKLIELQTINSGLDDVTTNFTEGLTKMLAKFGVDYDPEILHNAGNDAHYSMQLFERMMHKCAEVFKM